MRIGLISRHPTNLLMRQSPKGDGVAGTARFIEGAADGVDAIAVFDEPAKGQTTTVPLANRILVTTEPRAIKRYSIGYLNQFGTVVSPYPHWGFRGRLVRSHSGLPWFYGLTFAASGVSPALDFAALEQMQPEPRLLAISAVVSAKTQTPMHRRRLAFVELLQRRIGDRLLLFGQGFKPVADKAEAINACRYHLVLENSDDKHYWSEKLADAYLGWAFPLFSGTPAIGHYFPQGAFERIETANPAAAVEVVARVLAEDPWLERLPSLREARRRVLHEHNLLRMIANVASGLPRIAAQSTGATLLLGNGAATVRGRLLSMIRK